jgi:hypothetical protein
MKGTTVMSTASNQPPADETRVQANFRRVGNAAADLGALDFRSVPWHMKSDLAALQEGLRKANKDFAEYLRKRGEL